MKFETNSQSTMEKQTSLDTSMKLESNHICAVTSIFDDDYDTMLWFKNGRATTENNRLPRQVAHARFFDQVPTEVNLLKWWATL